MLDLGGTLRNDFGRADSRVRKTSRETMQVNRQSPGSTGAGEGARNVASGADANAPAY